MTVARCRVLVTTYERPVHLRRALAAWRRQTRQDFALTVADDGSGPETAAIVREFAAQAPFEVSHCWWEHRDFRRAGILNKAVRESAGEPLLLFTDGDCVPPSTFVSRHIEAHAPRTLQFGGVYWVPESVSEGVTVEDVQHGRHEKLLSLADRVKAMRRAWRAWRRRIRGKEPTLRVIGLNVGVDRSLFEEVNGFDEAYVGWGHEDNDLRDRILRSQPAPGLHDLWGRADTFHLWHLPTPDREEARNAAYFEIEKPVRCAGGLVDERRAPITARA